MAMDPSQLIQQLMAQQGGGGAPMPTGAPPPPAGPPTDEAMLDTVQNAMGERGGGGPPPGSGMKWEVLEDDQAALQQNPTPENVNAFIEYWGEENLPSDITAEGKPDTDDMGEA